ncbi:10622_t:CDS:2 [Funneliformis mosseae]|uniref:10622_t:CDS:1 n=1 Tax=Funneliformis mosseae TaxID=27381 RepID=A0A9N9D548_FUNMO|nr:10622_t:CDS:2 [Funneliformis mosseae]
MKIHFYEALSNGDDKAPVRCAITAIRKNLPCNLEDCEHSWYYEDLPNERGFKRIRKCSQEQPWNPIAMIDQHLPTKKVLDGVVARTCLSWTFLMQKLAEKFKAWDVSRALRYPIALGFKLIGRSRTEEESADMALIFKEFIDSLQLTCAQKNSIKEDLDINWMSDEWRAMIVDSYNLTSGDNQDNAGLIAFFNSQSFDHHDYYSKTQKPADMVRNLNLGRFYFLSGLVKPTYDPNCYYVKRHGESSLTLTSSYDGKLISLDENVMEKLNVMMNRFIAGYGANVQEGYYMANIKTGECLLCYDFIWNGRFRDTCKHVHAAKLYSEAYGGDFDSLINETKIKLIEYFNCREINETQQNILIRRGTVDEAFAEIQRLYEISGDKIFDSTMLYKETCRDPFRNCKQKRRAASKQSIPVTTKKVRISEGDQRVAINEPIKELKTTSYDLQRNELTTDFSSSFIDSSNSRVGKEGIKNVTQIGLLFSSSTNDNPPHLDQESGVSINEFNYSS